MIRTSPTHYITPSSISISPNANGSADDLAVYIQDGTKIKVYSRRAGIDYVNGVAQEWTLTGRNRRLGDSGKPYTIYARLDKTDKDNAYLVFAPKVQLDGFWLDKYPYVSTDSATDTNDVAVPTEDVVYSLRNYYYVRLGDVSLPENGQREVSFDTGVLGTDQFNTEWALNPDSLPLRIELGCTIDDEDAGPTPYVYWDKSLVLTATLVEGWTGTDIQRFDHWEITRNTGISGDDTTWPSQARREAFASSGQIMLNHTKGSDDDFNAAVATTFIITAMGHSEDPESQTLVTLATASIVILAETVEKYEMSFSTGIVSYNPQTESYTPTTGVAVRFRATDQRGDVFMLTRQQYDDAGLSVVYATVGSSSWTTVTPTGAAASEATVVIPVAAFASQQSVNVRLLNADGEELASGTIAFVRDGEDSREREWIFLRSATAITFGDILHPYPASIPYGEVDPPAAAGHVTDNKNQDGWVPEGWWDEMQGTDEEYPYEYGAYRDFVHDDTNGDHWGDFTTPKIWSHYAKDGRNAAVAVCTPSVVSIPTTVNGRVIENFEVEIAVRIYTSQFLSLSDVSVRSGGENVELGPGMVVAHKAGAVSFEGTTAVFSDAEFSDSTLVLDETCSFVPAYIKVKARAGDLLTEHSCELEVQGLDADGILYAAPATLGIQRNVYGADGQPGTDGYNTAVVTLYQRYTPTEQNPTPALPTGPMTYDFATGILSAADASYFNGWSQTPPNATANTKLFATQVSARSRQATDEILPNEWTLPIEIVLDGKDGKNAVRLDIDNEADMVQTDSTGHVTAVRQIITTVRLFDGEELQSIYLTTANVSGINVGTGTNLLPVITTAPDGKGKVLTWGFNTSMTLQDHYDITISYTYNGKAHGVVFTLSASKGLAIFQLKPGMSAIPFAYSGGAYTPASRALTLKVVKTDSGVDSEMEASAYGLSLIRYSFDAMPASKTAGNAWPGNSGVTVSNSGVSNVFIALFNSDGVRLDQESVPVVKDGVEGAAGAKSAMVIIYKRSVTQPNNSDRPSGNTVYNFSAGTLTPAEGVNMNNWSTQIPAVDANNPDAAVWTRQATAFSTETTATIGSSAWSGDQSGNAHKFVENGGQGIQGEAAVNVVVSPASLIVNQSLQNTSNLDNLSEQILFSVMKGSTALPVTKIDNIVVEKDGNRDKIQVIGSNSYTATLQKILKNANGEYYDRASFTCTVSYTDGNATKTVINVEVSVYANLLGDWKETVEADTKTEIGNSTWFDVDDDPTSPTYGEIIESDRLGTFIRSSKENTSRLEDDAYFKITGWSNLQIQISADDIAAYDNIYRLTFDMVSAEEDVTVTFAGTSINVKSYNTFEHEYTLSEGTYTLSFTKTSDGTAISPTVSNLALYAKTTTKYSQLKQTADGLTSEVSAIKSGKNLLPSVLTGSGWDSVKFAGGRVYTEGVEVDDSWIIKGSDYTGIASPAFSLDAGKHTLSLFADPGSDDHIYVSLRRTLKSNLIGDNIYSTAADGRYVFRFELESDEESLRFYVIADKIRYPQIEIGDFATAFDAGSSEMNSQIKQTADTIEARANDAGLVIDGTNNHINLIAGKVNFLTAGGSTNPKISIEPSTGALHAVDGEFDGVVKASAMFQKYQNVEVDNEINPALGSAIVIPYSNIGDKIYLPSASAYEFLTLTFYKYFDAVTIQTIARISASGTDEIYTNTKLTDNLRVRTYCKSFYPPHNHVIRLLAINGMWCLDCDESKVLAFYDDNGNMLTKTT